EGFWTQSPVHEPLLIPDGLQCGSRYGAQNAGDVRIAERAEARLCPRSVVRIVRVRRRAQAEQYQQGVEVSLKEHVYVYPLAEVAAVADVAMDQIVLALSRCSSVLNRQPIVVGGHVIHTGRRCSHAAINSLGAERSVQPQELRNIGPNKITRREAAKERARCDPATEFRSAEIG